MQRYEIVQRRTYAKNSRKLEATGQPWAQAARSDCESLVDRLTEPEEIGKAFFDCYEIRTVGRTSARESPRG